MRFPRKNITRIDVIKSEQLIIKAVQNGVNYFDTAYVYGGSEEVLGQIIQKNNLRDKIFLATKLPLGKCNKYEDFDVLFQTQLDRLRTNYIDYYLIHNLSDTNLWKNLCELGIEKWIEEKKKSGQIRNIGFSFHGTQNEFLQLLEAYEWDVCQIQYNYINTNYQAGTEGLKKAAEKGLPVIVMEPLLGGKLANGLPSKAVNVFKSASSARAAEHNSISPAVWSFRWLWNQKEVAVVLSGMNEDSQLEENITAANDSVPDMLTEEENAAYETVIKIFNASYKIPCTGCNYCMPCPHKVNIPGCFTAYNISYIVGRFSGILQYITSTGVTDPRKNYTASRCTKCGNCEKHCPQHISIIKSLEKVSKRMEPFWFKTAIKLFVKLRG
jgi:predicted aldo/keto reductase-like oxidoreductase